MWSLQLGDEGGLQEQLETIRVAASKTSPMMKACNLVSTCTCIYIIVLCMHVQTDAHSNKKNLSRHFFLP